MSPNCNNRHDVFIAVWLLNLYRTSGHVIVELVCFFDLYT